MSADPGLAALPTKKSTLPETGKHNVLVVAANRLIGDLLRDLVATGPEFSPVESWFSAASSELEVIGGAAPIAVLLWLSEISIPRQIQTKSKLFEAPRHAFVSF